MRRRRPSDLIGDGLYRDLATAFFEPPYRDVSIATLSKQLGAKPNFSKRSVERSHIGGGKRGSAKSRGRHSSLQEASCFNRNSIASAYADPVAIDVPAESKEISDAAPDSARSSWYARSRTGLR